MEHPFFLTHIQDFTESPLADSFLPHLHRIELLGVTVMEPSTVISSLLMTWLCVLACMRLNRIYADHPVHRFTRYFLICMGCATAVGGILGHGFLYTTGTVGKLPGWLLSLFAVAFYERAVIWYVRPLLSQKAFQRLLVWNVVSLLCFVLFTIVFRHFLIVQIQAFTSLCITVGALGGLSYAKMRDQGSLYIFTALGLAAVAVLIHASGWHAGEWLSTNDISHLPMAASIWYFYRAMESLAPVQAVVSRKSS